MRIRNLYSVILIFLSATLYGSYAQNKNAPAGQPVKVSVQTELSTSDSTIAIVYSANFTDEKRGITRLVKAIKGLDREFDLLNTDLQESKEQLRPVSTEMEEIILLNDVDEIQRRWKERVKLQQRYESKAKKVKEVYDKEYEQTVSPLMAQISKALEEYGRARGFSLVIDVSKNASAFYVLNSDLDITSDFIAYYNRQTESKDTKTTPQ